ncbi:MAG: hypothetical protein LBU73_10280 [Helicobacteraceae bacterium]|nr:hypothetical protein [Helicobacteraceae bacterium]
MKYRILLFLFFLPLNLLGESQVELIAAKVFEENNETRAEGDVSLRGDGKFIRADNLIYCRDTGEAELFGNVYFAQPGGDLMLADYLKLVNLDRRKGFVDHFFTMSNETPLWLSGNEAIVDGNITTIRSGAISGCEPASPAWSFRFSSAVHDQEEQWIDLYNPVFYAGRVPVFYSPYFGYHTDGKRHTGFLFPRWGTSNKEGTLFETPFYLAPMNEWDLEIWDQRRLRRGRGVGGHFRWVDSPYSFGRVNFGEFTEKQSYIDEYQVDKKYKNGGDLWYERWRVFTNKNSHSQEGLIADFQKYNDMGYIDLHSLDSRKLNYSEQTLVTNKADYFYKNDNIYLGVYARYFEDYKNPELNDEIVQILPESHGHLFTRSLLLDNLLFSADARSKNYTRKVGDEAIDYTISAPIYYHFSALGDYLNFDVGLENEYYEIDYSEFNNTKARKGVEKMQTFAAGVSTLVARPFGNNFHVAGLSATFKDNIYHSYEGVFDRNFTQRDGKIINGKSALFRVTQFLYDKKGSEIFAHRVSQPLSLEDNATWLELENEFTLRLFNQSLSNRTLYSHEYDGVTANTATLSGNILGANYSVTNIREFDYVAKERQTSRNYLNSSLDFEIFNGRIRGEYERDLLLGADRRHYAGFTYERGCYKTELSFERQYTPYISNGRVTSVSDDIVYLRLFFTPLGEVAQQLYRGEKKPAGD